MAYPSIEQYQEALQHPRNAFVDPVLAAGAIDTTGLGLPLVASGGFALTYAVKSASIKYAVRCFHKEAKGLERRYEAISQKLKSLGSPYFVDFHYQAKGVRANGGVFPIVKMAWASGQTLGEFVETHHGNRSALGALAASLHQLATYLEQQGIAHGDIQEGNLMVADGGRRVQLIDYDGMYVPELKALGGSELGHRDYQHPKRVSSDYDASLDRFSFIATNLALRALCEKPGLWKSSQSGAGVIVFRANDFAAPGVSSVLAEIANIPSLAKDARNFVAICAGRFADIPTLAQFLAGVNIPAYVAPAATSATAKVAGYISQYPVLDGAAYGEFLIRVGQMVELVGRVIEVSTQKTRYGKPYVFINFANWKGQCVKITLWSEALSQVAAADWPNASWVGKWITMRGLVEPVFRSAKFRYEHISLTATSVAHISQLQEAQAKYRLAGGVPPEPHRSRSSNADVLRQMTKTQPAVAPRSSPAAPKPTSAAPVSANQRTLQALKQQSRGATSSPVRAASPRPQQPPATKSSGFFGWLFDLFK